MPPDASGLTPSGFWRRTLILSEMTTLTSSQGSRPRGRMKRGGVSRGEVRDRFRQLFAASPHVAEQVDCYLDALIPQREVTADPR